MPNIYLCMYVYNNPQIEVNGNYVVWKKVKKNEKRWARKKREKQAQGIKSCRSGRVDCRQRFYSIDFMLPTLRDDPNLDINAAEYNNLQSSQHIGTSSFSREKCTCSLSLYIPLINQALYPKYSEVTRNPSGLFLSWSSHWNIWLGTRLV